MSSGESGGGEAAPAAAADAAASDANRAVQQQQQQAAADRSSPSPTTAEKAAHDDGGDDAPAPPGADEQQAARPSSPAAAAQPVSEPRSGTPPASATPREGGSDSSPTPVQASSPSGGAHPSDPPAPPPQQQQDDATAAPVDEAPAQQQQQQSSGPSDPSSVPPPPARPSDEQQQPQQQQQQHKEQEEEARWDEAGAPSPGQPPQRSEEHRAPPARPASATKRTTHHQPRGDEDANAGGEKVPHSERELLPPEVNMSMALLFSAACKYARLTRLDPVLASQTAVDARLRKLTLGLMQLASEHTLPEEWPKAPAVGPDGRRTNKPEDRIPGVVEGLPHDNWTAALANAATAAGHVASLPAGTGSQQQTPSSSKRYTTGGGDAISPSDTARMPLLAAHAMGGGPGRIMSIAVDSSGASSAVTGSSTGPGGAAGKEPCLVVTRDAGDAGQVESESVPLSAAFFEGLVAERRAIVANLTAKAKALASDSPQGLSALRGLMNAKRHLATACENAALVNFVASVGDGGTLAADCKPGAAATSSRADGDRAVVTGDEHQAYDHHSSERESLGPPPTIETAATLDDAVTATEIEMRRQRRVANDSVRGSAESRRGASIELQKLVLLYRNLTVARKEVSKATAARSAAFELLRKEKLAFVAAASASRHTSKARQADVLRLNSALRAALDERRALSAEVASLSHRLEDTESRLRGALDAASRRSPARTPPPAAAAQAAGTPPAGARSQQRPASGGGRAAVGAIRPSAAGAPQGGRRPQSAQPRSNAASTSRSGTPTQQQHKQQRTTVVKPGDLADRMYTRGLEHQRKLDEKLERKRRRRFRRVTSPERPHSPGSVLDVDGSSGGGAGTPPPHHHQPQHNTSGAELDSSDSEDSHFDEHDERLKLTAAEFAERLYYDRLRDQAKAEQRRLARIREQDRAVFDAGVAGKVRARPRSALERDSIVHRLYQEGVARKRELQTKHHEELVEGARPKMRLVSPAEHVAIGERLYAAASGTAAGSGGARPSSGSAKREKKAST